jgi:hypothetical protein
MTKHLYFTDLTKALYMMKEFKVIFIVGDQGYYNYENCLSSSLKDLTNRAKYYVAPESYHIFEQKEGDIGIQVTKESRDDGGYLAIAWALEYEDFVEFNETISPSQYWKIIMRDNKLFFQPETE